eukprot:SAG31_NODE_929_length_10926_cov_8.162834_2_plen_76_part_00
MLWSGASRDWAEAEPRLRRFRCALAGRGVAAALAPVGDTQSFGGCAGAKLDRRMKSEDDEAVAAPTKFVGAIDLS